MRGGRTTAPGTRQARRTPHRFMPVRRDVLRHQFGPGLALGPGQSVFGCSCGGPVWTGTYAQARRQWAAHAGGLATGPSAPPDSATDVPGGGVEVVAVWPAWAATPRHTDTIRYATRDAYEAAVASGIHDRTKAARHRGWLAAQEVPRGTD